MKDKNQARLRRARQTRHKISELKAVIDPSGDKVLTSASTLEPEVRKSVKYGGNIEAAAAIGKRIAEKAKALGIEAVAFDRGGYRYHGRVKALAEAAREHGLKF